MSDDSRYGTNDPGYIEGQRNPVPPLPIDYRSAGSGGPIAGPWVLALVLTIVFDSLVTALAFIVVPRFEQIFKDMKTDLPSITIVVLTISRWLSHSGGIVLVWIVSAIVPLLIALTWHPATDKARWRQRRWIYRLFVLAVGCLVMVIVLALFAPLISMINSINGPKGR
jgi:type II secretory pathway component PulF